MALTISVVSIDGSAGKILEVRDKVTGTVHTPPFSEELLIELNWSQDLYVVHADGAVTARRKVPSN